ncbi:hypothetical protein [Inmirania thermothiophila]|uniref:Uncharacterized protein n=1 Tax=Inmirania thermothiophila TaxID=1750597 RepID=A0A3N1Y4Y8_9GAMM|nr:hypothetical protein [Inmirania thermothiophila]ROR32692.1 hypothetical protein EDC57_1899 [Inmirania thermothiophila]
MKTHEMVKGVLGAVLLSGLAMTATAGTLEYGQDRSGEPAVVASVSQPGGGLVAADDRSGEPSVRATRGVIGTAALGFADDRS